MSESFAELFEESLQELEMAPGAIVTGTVIAIEDDFVIVNAGLKSEGVIPRHQFFDDNGDLTVEVGSEVKVALETMEDGFGTTQLSREKAKRAEAWLELEKAFEGDEIIKGRITGKVRGGFTVDVNTIHAFLPGSLVDVRPVRDTSHLESQELEFKLVKLDAKRNNIVVSRRAVLEAAYILEREKLLANMKEGQVVKGIVKNITDYGAFIDLGGVDGLLHITDIAWKRVKHPSEALTVGEEIDIQILRFDKEKNRVSLGLKQLTDDPWTQLISNYSAGMKAKAKVTNLTDYGCFAEIENGIEGLIHVSEMDWTNKNVHPSKVVQLGDEVDVMLLDIDKERRRISLGMKQCTPNPWQTFSEQFTKGDRVNGVIRSITDFGIFVGMDGGIDGLVHQSDLSWDDSDKDAVKRFKKGDEVEAVILSIDSERERIALGIKQLDGDPFSEYTSTKSKGETVKGTVSEITSKGLVLTLAEGVESSVRIAEVSRDRVENLSSLYFIGDEVEAMVVNIDRRSRVIALSIKQLEIAQEKKAMDSVSQQSDVDLSGPTTIGDLIKAQMKKIDSK
ncbi:MULTISPECIES: 30S ribosomal protein S1 [unclassified Neptuniibacter]|uniref:30S ribosomal protein S1 n=1 Tax=unclassified Neptuniibacter TaxID=2630693 RepID=UPI000C397D0E|nr:MULTISPECIES: 30S ribosomal protein S1 [unclassified Neptuniibacter]MAY42742.1 30S ribosomal protein S1 [Oceanospirillaceae bacterium]|tara:strand:+ start:64226 stop:65914 length:1689 start_codon:yes stop_codon:yes gene_type:complete